LGSKYPTISPVSSKFIAQDIDGKSAVEVSRKEKFAEELFFNLSLLLPIGAWTWQMDFANSTNGF
jgi:hypothetical protein